MAADLDTVLHDALTLTSEERADLVARLLMSLEPPPPSRDLSDDDWILEIERRARAALSGSEGISWEEVRERARHRMRKG